MLTRRAAGSISDEATTQSGNIFPEAMRTGPNPSHGFYVLKSVALLSSRVPEGNDESTGDDQHAA